MLELSILLHPDPIISIGNDYEQSAGLLKKKAFSLHSFSFFLNKTSFI